MVVLIASICTKSGKALISRQYVPIDRRSVESYIVQVFENSIFFILTLDKFSKLLSIESQHTFIETDSVRYLYQPLDTLYLLLITNKQSNIIEDLDTLSQFSKLIPLLTSPTEAGIKSAAFELVFAFDEVLYLGYRDGATLTQIKQYIEMDSQEERLKKLIEESKMFDAKEEGRRRAKMIAAMKNKMPSEDERLASMTSSIVIDSQKEEKGWKKTEKKTAGAISHSKVVNKGMKLVGKSKKPDFFEEKLPVISTPSELQVKSEKAKSKDDITLLIEERINASFETDGNPLHLPLTTLLGALRKVEIKGQLVLIIKDPDYSRIRIKLRPNRNSQFQFSPHPKLDKTLFSESSELLMKDTSKGFAVGTDNATAILKWRTQSSGSEMVPLIPSCWTDNQSNSSVVNIEYKAKSSLTDVSFAIPCKTPDPPTVNQVDGEAILNFANKSLIWKANDPKNGDLGSLEFVASGVDTTESKFLPIDIHFRSSFIYSGLEIDYVSLVQDEKPLDITCLVSSLDDKYIIE